MACVMYLFACLHKHTVTHHEHSDQIGTANKWYLGSYCYIINLYSREICEIKLELHIVHARGVVVNLTAAFILCYVIHTQ